jgi:NADH:ubiquinone oxidoreductase subunit C
MSFFDKLKDVSKKAGVKIQEGAKKQVDKMKDRRNAIKMLKTLKKSDLIIFCDEYGVDFEKSMTKDELIDQINFSGLNYKY